MKIKKRNKMRVEIVIAIFCVFVGLLTGTAYFFNQMTFNRDCGGHLELASNANSVEIAIEQLDIAIKYAEDNEMTHGYTSIFYQTPGDDIGFWYKNIRSARAQLDASRSASELEKSNLLLKLRETLTDHTSKGGEELAIPNGLSRYPHNLMWLICIVVCILSCIIALGISGVELKS